MQPSIPTETCWTGWLTALSGKALRRLMLLSLAFWLLFNTLPTYLSAWPIHYGLVFLSLLVFNFFNNHFGCLPSWLSYLYVCLLILLSLCVFVFLYLLIIISILLSYSSFLWKPVCWYVCFPAYLPAVIILCLSYLFEYHCSFISVLLCSCFSASLVFFSVFFCHIFLHLPVSICLNIWLFWSNVFVFLLCQILGHSSSHEDTLRAYEKVCVNL